MLNWEDHRRKDGTLDLVDAFLCATTGPMLYNGAKRWRRAQEFLADTEEFCPVRSKQAAAVALACAIDIMRGGKRV